MHEVQEVSEEVIIAAERDGWAGLEKEATELLAYFRACGCSDISVKLVHQHGILAGYKAGYEATIAKVAEIIELMPADLQDRVAGHFMQIAVKPADAVKP